jgi:zinc-ribbon domain
MARRVGYAAWDHGRMEANASGMICAKCGAPNAAGDAFCGSCGTCGAFLEFAAEEAGAPDAAAVGSPTTQAAISEIRLYGILVTP